MHSTYIRFSDCHTVCAFLLQLFAPTEISNSCLTLISQRSLITDLALGSFHPHRALGAWQALGTIRPIWTSVTHRALRSLRALCSIMCLWALITLGSLRPLGPLWAVASLWAIGSRLLKLCLQLFGENGARRSTFKIQVTQEFGAQWLSLKLFTCALSVTFIWFISSRRSSAAFSNCDARSCTCTGSNQTYL